MWLVGTLGHAGSMARYACCEQGFCNNQAVRRAQAHRDAVQPLTGPDAAVMLQLCRTHCRCPAQGMIGQGLNLCHHDCLSAPRTCTGPGDHVILNRIIMSKPGTAGDLVHAARRAAPLGRQWPELRSHLYWSRGLMSKPRTAGVRTSRPMQYSVAPAGTIRALGCTTLRLAASSR